MINFNKLSSRLVFFVSSLFLFSHSAMIRADDIQLPDMGNTADYGVNPVEEKRTGEAVIRNIRRGGGVVDDPLIEDYLDHLGFRLIANTHHADQAFKFFLINDKVLNAFALPGGYIGINYGLILATESESELASVMAHEVAHITQRHHARAFEAGSNQGPIIAALIAAMILGGGNSDIGQAAFAATAAGMMQSQINFTRANEKEADYMGIQMLANAGYDPMAMASFFGRLDKESSLYGVSAPEFLRSHPMSVNRMADASNRAAGLKKKQRDFDVQSFYLIRARIRALAGENKADTVTDFAKRLESGRYQNRTAEEYGYALALLNNKQYAKADKILNNLLAKDPTRIAYLVAKGQVESATQKLQQSQTTYSRALDLYPDNKVIIYYYVESLLKNKQYSKAKNLLDIILKTPGNLPQFYKFQSEAEAGLGNISSVHHALAEYYFYQGQPHEAVRQMQQAIKLHKQDDFYTNTKREARIADYQREIIP